VTLQLLWQEHRAVHPGGHAYSNFCDLHRARNCRLSPTMRQVHVAGEKLFVDYAGTTLSIVDGATGEVPGAATSSSRPRSASTRSRPRRACASASTSMPTR
jgi:transposase